jgi:hypothetical protein
MSITDTGIGFIINSARARLIPHPIGAPVLVPVPVLAPVLATVPVLGQPGRRAPLPGPLPPGSGPH